MEVKVCPSLLIEDCPSYSTRAKAHLFNGKKVCHQLDFDFEKYFDSQDIMENMGSFAVSGVQEKISAIIKDGKIIPTPKGMVGTHILKPAPLDYALTARKQVPANEHLTMQIASQVYGIKTVKNGLCFDIKDRPVYITKRLDILCDGTKALVEDFASILGRSSQCNGVYFKYLCDYEQMANSIKQVINPWEPAISDFFSLVIFNYIYGNGDAHLKNFSIMNSGNGYLLSPAYDLLNVSLHIDGDDLGLTGGLFSMEEHKSDIYQRKGHPCRTDFERFGLRIGLDESQIKQIINNFMEIPDTAIGLINRSFLDKKMRRKYLAIVKERTSRFRRRSE